MSFNRKHDDAEATNLNAVKQVQSFGRCLGFRADSFL